MTEYRPVDALPMAQSVFGMTRPRAIDLGICVACKRDVRPQEFSEQDAKEYEFSAIGPCCWERLLGPEDCE